MLRPEASHSRSIRASNSTLPLFSRPKLAFFPGLCLFLLRRLAPHSRVAPNAGQLFAFVCASRGFPYLNASMANFRYRPGSEELFLGELLITARLSPVTSIIQDQPSPASFRRRENQPDKAGLMAPPTKTSDATLSFASVTSTPIW